MTDYMTVLCGPLQTSAFNFNQATKTFSTASEHKKLIVVKYIFAEHF